MMLASVGLPKPPGPKSELVLAFGELQLKEYGVIWGLGEGHFEAKKGRN